MKRTSHNIRANDRTLPFWRIGPCLLAVAAIAFVPGMIPSPGSVNDARVPESRRVNNVTPVALQSDQPQAPDINLPEINLPDILPDKLGDSVPLSAEGIESNLRGSMTQDQLSAGDLAAANQMIESITPTDWLGPLAPIALSPFFGITCLSGLAMWSPEWMPASGLLDRATPLKSPALFWSFAALTIITSLPRLSKVSKPVAQAVDRVEAYAGIITLIVIRFMTSPDEVLADSPEIVQAGIVTMSVDALLYVAMVINVLVINSVKFFFEFMIWLTPVPFLDAMFEVANKTVCGMLMALYAFSPTLATVLNLAAFVVCLLVLRWIQRRVKFFRHMMFDSLWPFFSSPYGRPARAELVVFPKTDWNGFQDRSCLTLHREGDSLIVRQSRFLRSPMVCSLPAGTRLRITQGWLTNTLEITTDQPVVMVFSRRYQRSIAEVAGLLGAEVVESESRSSKSITKSEFA